MTNNFPAAPSNLQVATLNYQCFINYAVPNNESGINGIGWYYNFISQVDGAWTINYGDFDQQEKEAAITAAITAYCQLFAVFLGVEASAIEATVVVNRQWGWANEANMSEVFGGGSAFFTMQDTMPFTPSS
jgi:hypothetical protein